MMSSNYALMISLGHLPLPLLQSLSLSVFLLTTTSKLRLILKTFGDEMQLTSYNCHTNLTRVFSLGIFDVRCPRLGVPGTIWCLLAVIGTSCFKKGILCMTLMDAVASLLLRVEEPSPSMHPRALRPCHLLKEVVTTK